MLNGTKTSVFTQTTYEIDTAHVIEDATSSGRIRPTEVQVSERDGVIHSFTFTGPRQLPGHRGDARDSGTRVLGSDAIFATGAVPEIEKAAGDLADEVLALHLHETANVITDPDEIRTVLAKALGGQTSETQHDKEVKLRAYG
jgi:hypothetical protein